MSIENLELTWLNGEHGPFDQATISVAAHALHYGTSVFEGIRKYDRWSDWDAPTGEQLVWLLLEHIWRLRVSGVAYRMDYHLTDEELAQICLQVLANNPTHTYLRPVVFRDVNPESRRGLGVDPSSVRVSVGVLSAPWGRYVNSHYHNDGASVYIWNDDDAYFRPSRRFFPGHAKGAPGYGVWSQLAKQAANDAEASEALLCSEQKGDDNIYVVDGSGMNLYAVIGGRIITPDPVKWNILAGKTQQFLMEGMSEADTGHPAVEKGYGDLTIDTLLRADEVFLSGTATEVTPVTLLKWRGKNGLLSQAEIGTGHAGPITERCRRGLQAAVHGLVPRHVPLLTPVPSAVMMK